MYKALLLLALVMFVPTLHAQQSAEPISDNSFLIEEAYNQEPGVVQHINTFMKTRSGDWMYTFTQEWPVKSMKHQLSFTFVGLNADHKRGFGDTAVNYRYQLVDNDRVAVSPRISMLLPTGKSENGL